MNTIPSMTTTPQRSTESVLPVVRYELECADPPWRVRSVRLDEVMGEPYRGTIEALCDEPDVDARQLVGRDVRLSIHRGEVERLVLGLVQQVEMLGSDEHHARVVLRFGPALSLLGRGPASRVFQRMTIPELLEALVGPTFTARARELDLEGLSQRSFEPRDYCVQYQESDLEFLHRLLDEEGLSYRFEHDRGEHEVLVITDADRGLRDLDAWAGGMDVPLVTDRPEEASMESVERVQRRQRPAGPSVVQRDWDWMARPAQVFEHAGPARPDAEVTVVNHGGRRLWSLDTTGIAARQQQAHAASEDVLSGCGNVVGFAAGTVYELLDSEHDGRYVVTRVEHRGDAPAVDLADGGPATARPSYDNRFECIPADVPYRRPVRSSKPRIHGPQTAVVVGPDNEEIFTDEHGRIKVRLHWDRSTTVDEDASCWVRVAQSWAGPGWGSVVIPRVGTEVVISFLDGDPDRPLCTGCVFNGGSGTPYPLPDERTKTVLRTRSSPGGDGYNELCFEDAAGREQVMLRAQRDLRETIGHDHRRSVDNDESVTVGGRREVTVEGNQLVKVGGKGREGEGLPSPHYGVEVDGDYSLQAEVDALVEAKSSIRLRCGETLVELTPTTITLRAGNGARVVLDAAALVESKPGASVHLDERGHLVAQSTGPAKLSLDDAARLRSKAGSQVTLAGDAKLEASAPGEGGSGAALHLDADATLLGNEVALTSAAASLVMTDGASLTGATIELGADEITCAATQELKMSAATVEAAGTTLTTITAPLVKIN